MQITAPPPSKPDWRSHRSPSFRPFRHSAKKILPPLASSKPVLYYPVGGLPGKLTVTAKLAPGCPAPPWRARPVPHSFAPSRRPSRAGWVQARPHGQSRQKPRQSRLIKPNQGKRQILHIYRHSAPKLPICVYLRLSAVRIPRPPETRAPGSKTRFSRQSRQIKPNQTVSSSFACSAYFAVPAPCLPDLQNPGTVPDVPRHQASIKAQTPVIVLHQGSSRLIKAKGKKLSAMTAPSQPTTRLFRHWMLGVRCWLLDVSTIKPHQGKRQFSVAPPSPGTATTKPASQQSASLPGIPPLRLRLRAFALSPTSARTGANVTPCECDWF